MTQEFLSFRRINFKLATACKINPTQDNKIAYSNYRKFYQSSVRSAKRQHFIDKMIDAGPCSRRIWGVINLAANKPTKTSSIDSLNVDGNLITGEREIADIFNDHFSSIGTKVAQSLPNPPQKLALETT